MPSISDASDDLSIESTARWAFRLSYFLLADRRDARSVLYQAAARLYVTALTQRKRQARRPKGDVHKKLSLTPRPLLQYLLYLCAEPYERAQEQEYRAGARALTVEDMVVRYVKHLMLLYMEHNSFYAAVGQSSVLFDYGTSQAMRLYEVLVQGSPAHLQTKGDYSVRDAKRNLRRGLAERFEGFVTTYDGTRKEHRFVAMGDAGAHFRLVKLCLHSLRPAQEAGDPSSRWHLPARFDLPAYDLGELQYDEGGADSAAEQAAELRRVHVVTHPCCWARLLRAAHLHYSRRHVVLPEFILANNESADRKPRDERRRPPELTPAELEGLTKTLRSEARRRKGLLTTSLSVAVDGEPRGSWTADRDRELTIRVDACARVLALSARDAEGEVLLAQHLLRYGGASGRGEGGPAAVTLEGGQEVTFTASPDAEGAAGYLVTIRFRETRLRRSLARHAARSYGRLVGLFTPGRPFTAGLKAAVSFCAVILVLLTLGWWAARSLWRTPRPSRALSNQAVNPPPGRGVGSESAPAPGPGAAAQEPGEVGAKRRGTEVAQESRPHSNGSDISGSVRMPRRVGRRGPAAATHEPTALLNLRDGERRVRMDVRGRVTGLEGLSPEWRREVEAVLQARRVQRPAQLGELGVEAEVLLGRTDGGRGADIVGPVGKVVESDRPSFRWSGPADASGYTVAVFDSHFKQVAQSGLLSVTEWTPPEALQRGTTYVWKVTTFRDGEAIVSPSPPAPEARFMVLGRAAADELARARRLRPASHLTLGVLYARAGMTDEAEREFQALAASNPDSGAARDLLLSVREWRRTP